MNVPDLLAAYAAGERRFSDADLSDANLSGANLSGANLSGAYLAQVNEIHCKFLCHNICVLIASIYELGIEPEFWGAKGEAS